MCINMYTDAYYRVHDDRTTNIHQLESLLEYNEENDHIRRPNVPNRLESNLMPEPESIQTTILSTLGCTYDGSEYGC